MFIYEAKGGCNTFSIFYTFAIVSYCSQRTSHDSVLKAFTSVTDTSRWWLLEGHSAKIAPVHQKSPTLHGYRSLVRRVSSPKDR